MTIKSGVTYDYETKLSYFLAVDVSDGNDGQISTPATVKLTDVNETSARGTMDTARLITRTAARSFQFTLTKESVVAMTLPFTFDAALYVP